MLPKVGRGVHNFDPPVGRDFLAAHAGETSGVELEARWTRIVLSSSIESDRPGSTISAVSGARSRGLDMITSDACPFARTHDSKDVA